MKVKVIFGKIIYPVVKNLPASYSLGGGIAKWLRARVGRLIMNRCGKNVNIEKGAYYTRKTEIGNNSGIGINAYISGKVIIGDNVLMAPNVTIITSNHNFMKKDELISSQGNSEEKPVIIGNDVWIGTNVIILPGVHIANGTVVAAGSIVTKNTEEYAVVGGNPAKTIKHRK